MPVLLMYPTWLCSVMGYRSPLETAGSGEQVDLVCQARATLMENVTVPAWSEVEVLASTNSLCGSGTWLVEGLRDKNVPQVLVAGAVVKPIQDRELVCIPVHMVNPSPVAVTVYKGMAVAVAERIADSHIAAAVHGPVDNRVGWNIGTEKRNVIQLCAEP